MPYRFVFDIAQGAGAYSGDPVLHALDDRISRAIYTQVQPLAAALQEILPILTDEEWEALPLNQQRYFCFTDAAPRPFPNHEPAPQRVVVPSGTSAEEERMQVVGAGVFSQALDRLAQASALPVPPELEGVRPLRRAPRLTTPRRPQTFNDTEPEDI